jgi:hypothetical protein
MRIDVEELKLKALLALEEGAMLVDQGKAVPNFGLRLALAYLYAVGDGERWLFEDYWSGITGKAGKGQASDYLEDVVRGAAVNAALNGIWRSVGVERHVEPMHQAQAIVRSKIVPPR